MTRWWSQVYAWSLCCLVAWIPVRAEIHVEARELQVAGTPVEVIGMLGTLPDGSVLASDKRGLLQIASHHLQALRHGGGKLLNPQGQAVFHQGRWWMGSVENGVLAWASGREIIQSFPLPELLQNPVWNVTPLSDNALLLATFGSGVLQLDLGTGRYSPWTMEGEAPESGVATRFLQAGDTLLVGTFGRGVLKANRAEKRLENWLQGNADIMNCGLNVYKLLQVDTETVLAATRKGVLEINIPAASARCLNDGDFEQPGLAPLMWRNLAKDAQGNIWLGGDDRLMVRRHGQQKFESVFLHVDGQLRTPSIRSDDLLVDQAGVLWLRDERNHILQLAPNWAQQRLEFWDQPWRKDETPKRIFLDSRQRLWLSNGKDRLIQKDRDGTVTVHQSRADRPIYIISSIVEDAQGDVWFANQSTLLVMHAGTLQQRQFGYGSANVPGGVYFLQPWGQAGVVASLYARGLLFCSVDTLCQVESLKPYLQYSSLQIDAMLARPEGLLLGIGQDMWRYQPEQQTLQPVMVRRQGARLREKWVYMRQFAQSGLWLVSDHAIYQVRPRNGELEVVQGIALPFSVATEALAMVEDDQGRIWLRHGDSLYWLDPEHGRLRWVSSMLGRWLATNLVVRDGELGGISENGLRWLKLDGLRHEQSPTPQPRIAYIRTSSGSRVLPGASRPLFLPYEQRFAEIGLGVNDLYNGRYVHFRWRLKSDQPWVDLGQVARITLAELSPGEHLLEVQAYDERSRQYSSSLRVPLRVGYPPWRQPWAYLLYAFSFVGLMFVLFAWRARSQRLKDIQKQRERVLAVQAAMKEMSRALDPHTVFQGFSQGMQSAVPVKDLYVWCDDLSLPQPAWLMDKDAAWLRQWPQAQEWGSCCLWPAEQSSLLCHPVYVHGRLLALVVLQRGAGGKWSDLDVIRLMSYSEYFALTLSNARLYQKSLELTEQALQASEAKSEFIAKVSHEIRTPMNGVLGMAELLSKSELTEQQKEQVRVIESSGQILLTLIDEILDLSKIESGRMELLPTETNIRDVVDDCLKVITAERNLHQTLLSAWVTEQLPDKLMLDRHRLRQILLNLLGNACKFARGGEVALHVSLEAHPEGATLCMEVLDDGPGISPEKQQQLFQPFVQADAQIQHQFGGTGLGLAISRQLVELMGGEITLQSEPGQGCCFTVRIPLQVQPARVDPVPVRYRGLWLTQRQSRWFGKNVLRLFAQVEVELSVASRWEEGADDRLDILLLDATLPELPAVLEEARRRRVGTVMFMGAAAELAVFRHLQDTPSVLPEPLLPGGLKGQFARCFVSQMMGASPVAEKAELRLPAVRREILLVSADQVTQELLSQWVEEEGHVLDITDDLEEGRRRVYSRYYDLLLMDYGLWQPGEDWMDLHTCKVLLTGHADPHFAQSRLSEGFDRVWLRPLERTYLLEILAGLPASN